jgi:hypothetical protein
MNEVAEWKREAARKVAGSCYEGASDVYFLECPICGYLRWHSSSNQRAVEKEEPRLHFQPMKIIGECARCFEICQRSPEIYRWVRGVAQKIIEQTATPHSAETT